jgi:hypothetical protein
VYHSSFVKRCFSIGSGPAMPVLGKLVLKGGQSVGGVKKKKKGSKSKRQQGSEAGTSAPDEHAQAGEGETGTGGTITTTHPGFLYEKEFKFESERMNEGKARSTAWGATYSKAPTILHGYDKQVKGDTYEERLDLRCAKKADRMCK